MNVKKILIWLPAIVMEKLGGGGHISIAGAQFTDCTIDQAINKIKLTLDNMIKDGEI